MDIGLDRQRCGPRPAVAAAGSGASSAGRFCDEDAQRVYMYVELGNGTLGGGISRGAWLAGALPAGLLLCSGYARALHAHHMLAHGHVLAVICSRPTAHQQGALHMPHRRLTHRLRMHADTNAHTQPCIVLSPPWHRRIHGL